MGLSVKVLVLSILTLLVVIATVQAQSGYYNPHPPKRPKSCSKYPPQMRMPPASQRYRYKKSPPRIEPTIKLWQSIVFVLGVGAFALFISLLYLNFRKRVYLDWRLFDTFFDAGGCNNFALVAIAVLSQRLLMGRAAQSTAKVGLVGHFWDAAVTASHLLLFSIVAYEFRVKAPGAKTFLQVIRCRFGVVAHILLMIFALVVNVLLAGAILNEGAGVVASLTHHLGKEVMCILLFASILVFTVIGGVGGRMQVAYFSCTCLVVVMIIYHFGFYYESFQIMPTRMMKPSIAKDVCHAVNCVILPPNVRNTEGSALTFSSVGGVIHAVVTFLINFGVVFVNQSYWTSAVTAKPSQAVWGFILAGCFQFAVVFVMSFTMGIAFWALTIREGKPIVSEAHLIQGYMPVVVSQMLMGRAGDYMMIAITAAVVIVAVSSEILSMSAIFMYDIYQTYIRPFVPPPRIDKNAVKSAANNAQLWAFLRYNFRSIRIRNVTVFIFAHIPLVVALIMHVIRIDMPYILVLIGVISSSAVLPVVLSILWFRTTATGVNAGVILGFISALVSWLVFASTYESGMASFYRNTVRPEVILVGAGSGLVFGGLVCVLGSLCSGGTSPDRKNEDEWEKCRRIDNPLMPWTTRFSNEIYHVSRQTGLPHYYEMRKRFRSGEVSAYVVGGILTVVLLFVIAPLMLLAGVFDCGLFGIWMIIVLVMAIVAAIVIVILPFIANCLQMCRDCRYRGSIRHETLVEDDSSSDSRSSVSSGDKQVLPVPILSQILSPEPDVPVLEPVDDQPDMLSFPDRPVLLLDAPGSSPLRDGNMQPPQSVSFGYGTAISRPAATASREQWKTKVVLQ